MDTEQTVQLMMKGIKSFKPVDGDLESFQEWEEKDVLVQEWNLSPGFLPMFTIKKDTTGYVACTPETILPDDNLDTTGGIVVEQIEDNDVLIPTVLHPGEEERWTEPIIRRLVETSRGTVLLVVRLPTGGIGFYIERSNTSTFSPHPA